MDLGRTKDGVDVDPGVGVDVTMLADVLAGSVLCQLSQYLCGSSIHEHPQVRS